MGVVCVGPFLLFYTTKVYQVDQTHGTMTIFVPFFLSTKPMLSQEKWYHPHEG